jgi:hypothetical protein
MLKKKYRVSTLPLPIRPKGVVFFVVEEKSLDSGVVESVGINEEGQLLVVCDGQEYEVGIKDRVFLTREDAQQYLEDPSGFPEDYGVVQDYGSLKLPYYPGTFFFFCDYDGFAHRWEIFEEYCTFVFFDEDGSVRVGDVETEFTVMGKLVDPCFETYREARAYIREQMR